MGKSISCKRDNSSKRLIKSCMKVIVVGEGDWKFRYILKVESARCVEIGCEC